MTVSSILSELDTFVNSEIAAAKTDISSWWTSFEPIAEADFQAFVAAIKPIALALVTGLASAAISGPAKLAAVSGALISAAESQGIKATTVMANTVVQQVVASLSSAKPPATN